MTKLFRRTLHAALLLTLVLMAGMPTVTARITFAQDGEPASDEVVVAGSRYVQDLLQRLVDDYNTASEENDAAVQFDAQGNADGFTRLCSGAIDAVMATEAITDEQLLACDSNAIQFIELVLAYEALVLVPSAGAPATCVARESLPSILGQGGAAQLNWTVVNPTAVPGDVTLYGPDADSQEVVGFVASLLPDAPRTDYTEFESPEAVIATLSDPANSALAFMTFAQWEKIEDQAGLAPLQVSADGLATCIAVDAGSIATGTYTFQRPLMLYANATSFGKPGFVELLQRAVSADGLPVADNEFGFTAPVQAVLDRGLNNINGPIVGRTFTRPDSPVTLNTAAEGTITVGGSALASTVTKSIYDSFKATYANVTFNLAPFGNDQSWAAFCAGETSVIQVTRAANEAELAICTQNGVDAHTVMFGAQAVVLVVKADSDLPVCVSYENLAAMLVQTVKDPQAGVLNPDATPESTESAEPTDVPTEAATEAATEVVTEVPTEAPTEIATEQPTEAPTEAVTEQPAESATEAAAEAPTEAATETATEQPTEVATEAPTEGEPTPEATPTEPPLPPAPLDPEKLQGPARWNEVDPTWPDRELLIFAPGIGALETDIILTAVAEGQNLRRTDAPVIQMSPVVTAADGNPSAPAGADQIPDVQYRVGATANFDGAITYLLWTALQSDPGKDGVRVVQVDGGNGCVEPTEETILNGSYPFSHSSMLVFSKSALSDEVVAALLWQIYNVDVLNQIETLGLVGFDREALDGERENIFTLIEEARRAASAQDEPAEGEATPEATDGEPTAEPTEGATEVPTEAPTEVATEAPTEAATETAIEVPTEVATEQPTESPTEAPTQSATQAAQ